MCEESSVTPQQYFKGRDSFSKNLKRNVESKPFYAKANHRIRTSQSPQEKYSRMTPAMDMFLYDGILNYDTMNIDLNPYVMDVGCTDRKLYIRLKLITEDENYASRYFKQGVAIVSSKYGFSCTRHGLSSSDRMTEDLLYRKILHSKLIQSEGMTYVELDTAPLTLPEMISQFSFQLSKNPTERKTTTTSKRWVTPGIKIAQLGWKFNTESESGPATQQYSHSIIENIVSVACTDCYTSFGLGFSFELASAGWFPDTFKGFVNYDVTINTVLNAKLAKQEYPYSWHIFPEGEILNIQEVWIIPIRFILSGKLLFELQAAAEVDVDFKFGYKLSGSAAVIVSSVVTTQVLADPPTSNPTYGIDFKTISGSVSAKLLSSVVLSLFSVFKMEIDFNPQVDLSVSNTMSPNCQLGFDTKAGLTGGFTLHEWNILGLLKGDTFYYPFDFFPVSKIPYISDICIIQNGRRELLTGMEMNQIEWTQSSTCCSVQLNDTKSIVGAIVNIPSDSFEYYDAIILKLGYTKTCLIQYGNKTISTSSDSIQIQLDALKQESTFSIKVTFQKEINEIVTVDYSYVRSSLVLGQETKIRTGTVLVDIQQSLPSLLAIRVTGGVLTKQTGEIVAESIETSSLKFPLVWFYEGNGTVTIYPFYDIYSGQVNSHLILKNLRFGLIYHANSLNSQGLSLDSLKLYSRSSAKKSSDMLDFTVKVKQLSQIKVSDIYDLTGPESSKNQQFSTQFNTIPNYILFDLVGNVNFFFKIELIELYSKHVNAPFAMNYETVSPFGLAITQDAKWASSGLVFTIGKNTLSFADSSLITDSSKFDSVFRTLSNENKASFGFSKFSMTEWIGKKLYLRLEPKNLHQASRSSSKTFSGSISIDALKNDNITISIKFYDKKTQTVMDTISLNELSVPYHKIHMSISINDDQYTFNEFILATVGNFENFLNTIRTKKADSKWNTIILPLLSFKASTSSDFDFEIVSPQEMRFSLPVYPKIESTIFTEQVSFSSISTGVFTPSPGKVSVSSSVTVTGDNYLSGGDIGSIISSVVGFSIIVLLLVVVVILLVIKCPIHKARMVNSNTDMEMNKK